MTARVRYIVDDVDAAIAFYTGALGFKIDFHPAPGFAAISRAGLQLLLNRSGAGGAGQAMPDGREPAPGGWNRIQIETDDLDAMVERLCAGGHHFRNEVVAGQGGRQIILEDPAGNPIELFEPSNDRTNPASAPSENVKEMVALDEALGLYDDEPVGSKD